MLIVLAVKLLFLVFARILELRKAAKRAQGNFDFTTKIEGRSITEFIQSNHVNRQELMFLCK